MPCGTPIRTLQSRQRQRHAAFTGPRVLTRAVSMGRGAVAHRRVTTPAPPIRGQFCASSAQRQLARSHRTKQPALAMLRARVLSYQQHPPCSRHFSAARDHGCRSSCLQRLRMRRSPVPIVDAFSLLSDAVGAARRCGCGCGCFGWPLSAAKYIGFPASHPPHPDQARTDTGLWRVGRVRMICVRSPCDVEASSSSRRGGAGPAVLDVFDIVDRGGGGERPGGRSGIEAGVADSHAALRATRRCLCVRSAGGSARPSETRGEGDEQEREEAGEMGGASDSILAPHQKLEGGRRACGASSALRMGGVGRGTVAPVDARAAATGSRCSQDFSPHPWLFSRSTFHSARYPVLEATRSPYSTSRHSTSHFRATRCVGGSSRLSSSSNTCLYPWLDVVPTTPYARSMRYKCVHDVEVARPYFAMLKQGARVHVIADEGGTGGSTADGHEAAHGMASSRFERSNFTGLPTDALPAVRSVSLCPLSKVPVLRLRITMLFSLTFSIVFWARCSRKFDTITEYCAVSSALPTHRYVPNSAGRLIGIHMHIPLLCRVLEATPLSLWGCTEAETEILNEEEPIGSGRAVGEVRSRDNRIAGQLRD
ncbi:hypothetical protein K438DRAFT_1782421 [Mycena galopus ATCC 62051]|nr:hypothetical protein K438DRAFT_1782421 [Mycena galopus ATCC 62051]